MSKIAAMFDALRERARNDASDGPSGHSMMTRALNAYEWLGDVRDAFLAEAAPEADALASGETGEAEEERFHLWWSTSLRDVSYGDNAIAEQAALAGWSARAALLPVPVAQDWGEAKPFMWVREHEGYFNPSNGDAEPPTTEFLSEPAPDAFPLYRHPAPVALQTVPIANQTSGKETMDDR